MSYLKCKLCGKQYPENEMSEEHYPAKSVGNNDIVKLNLMKVFDSLNNEEFLKTIEKRIKNGESIHEVAGEYFDNEIAESAFPLGRTARTLCRECNTFLGRYDEAYLKFYLNEGNPSVIKGFQKKTRVYIIKSILGKFLSIPEAQEEVFDFLDYLRDDEREKYEGSWHLYFVKRNINSDLMGMMDISTGKLSYEQGVVYELSDEKFIFNLMNFEKHSCYEMTDFFDILKANYTITDGTGPGGEYHAQLLMSRWFRELL